MMDSPVIINGVRYPSQGAAARALGVSPVTISRHKKRAAIQGATGDIAVSTDLRLRPTVIDGVHYASRAAAARALGVSGSAITQRMRREGGERKVAKSAQKRICALRPPVVVATPQTPAQRPAKPAHRNAPVFPAGIAAIAHPHWSPCEDHQIMVARQQRCNFTDIAAQLGRPRIAVEQRFHRLRVIPGILSLLKDYGLTRLPYMEASKHG